MRALFLPKAGAFIRYHDFPGEEPALVLLHGLGSASSCDFPYVARHPLFSGRRVVFPDLLGFGFSDKPDGFDYSLESHAETIFELLASLDLSKCFLFGHSMGGTIAIVLAARHPDLASRLTIAEANLDPGIGQISKMISDQEETDYVARGHSGILGNLILEAKTEPSLLIYSGAFSMADPLAVHRSATGLIRSTNPSPRELFLSMRMPRSFIFGERSLPDSDVGFLGSKGIKVLVVPGAGHAMMHDNPEGFASKLSESFE